MRRFVPLLCLLAACDAPSETSVSPSDAHTSGSEEMGDAERAADLRKRIAQFAPADISADISALPMSERQALVKLMEAASYLNPIFDRQAWLGNPKLRAELSADSSALGQLKLEYFDIMRGPWDRQKHFAPFAVDHKRPPGAGFYPEDLSVEDFRGYVSSHPELQDKLEGLFTLVVREEDGLTGVRYSDAYAQWLNPAAAKMQEAAALTKNASLRRFLLSRAEAFASDDYYVSDKDWMDLDSRVEITIGPYETYEDELLGLKASFEAFVTVSDPVASAELKKYKALLPIMEENLPTPDAAKAKRGGESPIRVVDLVYSSGDARKSVQTIAFNLPNDERVRKEKGAKKVLLRNLIKTKFDRILEPLANRILAEEQLQYLSADAFFNEVLFHELSHSLGPAYTKGGKEQEVRLALGASASALEEAKADVMGAYNILFMVDKEEFPASFRNELLISYYIGLFRSVRFGVAEAHGKGAALQINRFLEEGAASFDQSTGRYKVDLNQLEVSIRNLVRDICLMQYEGDKVVVDEFLTKYAVMSDSMDTAIGSLDGIPVDIRPSYPLGPKR